MEWSQITEHPDLLLMLLAPIFFLCIAAEYWFGQRGVDYLRVRDITCQKSCVTLYWLGFIKRQIS